MVINIIKLGKNYGVNTEVPLFEVMDGQIRP
jgi:hypothetical protein